MRPHIKVVQRKLSVLRYPFSEQSSRLDAFSFALLLTVCTIPFSPFFHFFLYISGNGDKTSLFVSPRGSWPGGGQSWYVCKLASDSP